MSLWCDDFYVTPQGYYVIKVITNKVITWMVIFSVVKKDHYCMAGGGVFIGRVLKF